MEEEEQAGFSTRLSVMSDSSKHEPLSFSNEEGYVHFFSLPYFIHAGVLFGWDFTLFSLLYSLMSPCNTSEIL